MDELMTDLKICKLIQMQLLFIDFSSLKNSFTKVTVYYATYGMCHHGHKNTGLLMVLKILLHDLIEMQ